MLYWLLLLVTGLVVGYALNPLVFKGKTFKYGGTWSVLGSSLIGAWGGDYFLGDWGLVYGDYNLIAGLIGAVVLNFVWDYIAMKK